MARVDALIDRDIHDRLDHVFRDDLDDGEGRIIDRAPEGLGHIRFDRRPRFRWIECNGAPEKEVGIDVAKRHGCVGYSRLRSTLAVTHRPRNRPRALRPDMQHAAVVHPRDRAAARADAFHIDRGEPCHVAPIGMADPGLARPRDARSTDEADVVGRAASVGDDGGVRTLVGLSEVAAGNRRHRRAGIDEMNRLVRDFRGVDNAALRSYDQRPARKSIVPQVAGQTLHVSGHHWLERSIDAGGGGAAIFAQGRVELVRKRIGNAQHMLFNQLADAQFVLWIDDRPQETDRDGLDVFPLHGLDGRDHYRVRRRASPPIRPPEPCPAPRR